VWCATLSLSDSMKPAVVPVQWIRQTPSTRSMWVIYQYNNYNVCTRRTSTTTNSRRHYQQQQLLLLLLLQYTTVQKTFVVRCLQHNERAFHRVTNEATEASMSSKIAQNASAAERAAHRLWTQLQYHARRCTTTRRRHNERRATVSYSQRTWPGCWHLLLRRNTQPR